MHYNKNIEMIYTSFYKTHHKHIRIIGMSPYFFFKIICINFLILIIHYFTSGIICFISISREE